jgi:hypothetical protein
VRARAIAVLLILILLAVSAALNRRTLNRPTFLDLPVEPVDTSFPALALGVMVEVSIV